MEIWKTDGTRKVYIFEDGSEVPFTDKAGYARKKAAPSPGQKPVKEVKEEIKEEIEKPKKKGRKKRSQK
jgi:hypothetical protein